MKMKGWFSLTSRGKNKVSGEWGELSTLLSWNKERRRKTKWGRKQSRQSKASDEKQKDGLKPKRPDPENEAGARRPLKPQAS